MTIIKEKSLSRTLDKIKNHDCGTITAYRSEYTKQQNQQRNKSLLSKLMATRYGVTTMIGSYIENYGSKDEIEVKETIFFVEDILTKGNLKDDLKKFGEEFDQDSILFIPQGGGSSILIGTSPRENSFPGYRKEMKVGDLKFGKSGEFMTKIGNRPFKFESVENGENKLPEGYFGRWGLLITAKKHWNEIEL